MRYLSPQEELSRAWLDRSASGPPRVAHSRGSSRSSATVCGWSGGWKRRPQPAGGRAPIPVGGEDEAPIACQPPRHPAATAAPHHPHHPHPTSPWMAGGPSPPHLLPALRAFPLSLRLPPAYWVTCDCALAALPALHCRLFSCRRCLLPALPPPAGWPAGGASSAAGNGRRCRRRRPSARPCHCRLWRRAPRHAAGRRGGGGAPCGGAGGRRGSSRRRRWRRRRRPPPAAAGGKSPVATAGGGGVAARTRRCGGSPAAPASGGGGGRNGRRPRRWGRTRHDRCPLRRSHRLCRLQRPPPHHRHRRRRHRRRRRCRWRHCGRPRGEWRLPCCGGYRPRPLPAVGHQALLDGRHRDPPPTPGGAHPGRPPARRGPRLGAVDAPHQSPLPVPAARRLRVGRGRPRRRVCVDAPLYRAAGAVCRLRPPPLRDALPMPRYTGRRPLCRGGQRQQQR
ncbi:hypothetical protein I4F81_008385 [Pyropia yezoensis]|uniref:Uncharacterized protein n=1 Tax=Pyropia yezoensis TaxID=2788 RepID=A0ACC3C6R7_PYRYE|nr:hypothetical protein I4F81_008385 [Neopyropia yezoensis]